MHKPFCRLDEHETHFVWINVDSPPFATEVLDDRRHRFHARVASTGDENGQQLASLLWIGAVCGERDNLVYSRKNSLRVVEGLQCETVLGCTGNVIIVRGGSQRDN